MTKQNENNEYPYPPGTIGYEMRSIEHRMNSVMDGLGTALVSDLRKTLDSARDGFLRSAGLIP